MTIKRGRAGRAAAIDAARGPASPDLRALCEARMDVQKVRLAMLQRGELVEAEVFRAVEGRMDRRISKALREHPIWPWLSQFPGLGGVQTARLIALIANPHRFPGQRCSEGHYLPAGADEDLAIETAPGVGGPCPLTWRLARGHRAGPAPADETPCTGILLPSRAGTGTRSLWHYLGLHVVDGRSPRKVKGQRADWQPAGRTAVLMPGGIADAIVKARTPVYRDIYDAAKSRLAETRGVEPPGEIEAPAGPAPLRPFQVDALAKKIAAKAFVGDLLRELKSCLPVEPSGEVDESTGREAAA
jgi:hypothetical protein